MNQPGSKGFPLLGRVSSLQKAFGPRKRGKTQPREPGVVPEIHALQGRKVTQAFGHLIKPQVGAKLALYAS